MGVTALASLTQKVWGSHSEKDKSPCDRKAEWSLGGSRV